MDCSGLALAWEGCASVRGHVREHKQLLVHPATAKFCEPTRPNSVANSAILKPALRHLARTPGFKLPHLENLQNEISMLMSKLGIQLGDQGAYKPSVELKKLLGFIKRRAARKEVTKEQGCSIVFVFAIIVVFLEILFNFIFFI